jgi:hypothetical protein
MIILKVVNPAGRQPTTDSRKLSFHDHLDSSNKQQAPSGQVRNFEAGY